MPEKKIPDDAWAIAKARIEAMPSGLKMSIGSYGTLTKVELLEEIDKHSDIGKLIAEAQLDFLRRFKQRV
jgi:hypothetical protein